MTNDLSIRMSKVTNQTSPPSPPSNSKRTDSVPSRPNPLTPTVPTKPNERDPRNPSRSPPWPTSKLRPPTKTGPHPQWPSLFGLSAISTQKGTSKDRAGTTSANSSVKTHPNASQPSQRSYGQSILPPHLLHHQSRATEHNKTHCSVQTSPITHPSECPNLIMRNPTHLAQPSTSKEKEEPMDSTPDSPAHSEEEDWSLEVEDMRTV